MRRAIRRNARWAGLIAALAVSLSAGSTAPAATGGVLDGCSQQLSQPFLPWFDPSNYFLVPGGDFETGASEWTLSGARIAAGSEPWHVAGPGTAGLSLPSGAQATSPAVCIGLLHPTMRFFARNSAPLGLGLLEVEVDVQAAGLKVTLPVALITAGGSYGPTLPWPLLANLTAPLSGTTGSVTLHFRALSGNWQVDDVYLDPFKTA